MPKISSLSLIFLFACSIAVAQSPHQFAYQAVVRDNNNQLVSNRTIGMRVSILKDSTNGQSPYTETHNPKTNQQGIVQLNIGGGTLVSGSFASVPWSIGKLFVKTEMDLQGGTNYTITVTTQLLSVPYAIYSSNVAVSKSGDTVTIGTSKLIIPGSQLLPGTAPASLSNGLVAYYPFNGNANDESGNGNHGTVNGATLTIDRFGNPRMAYMFDGVDDRIEKVQTNNFPISNAPRTISLWFKINGRFNINNLGLNLNGYGSLVDYGKFSANNRFGLLMTREFAPYCVAELNDYLFNFSVPLQKWNHIILTASGNRCELYVNGNIIGSGVLGLSLNTIEGRLSIGNTINDPAGYGQNEAFNGNIDDIRIYNRALTQDEITYLANN